MFVWMIEPARDFGQSSWQYKMCPAFPATSAESVLRGGISRVKLLRLDRSQKRHGGCLQDIGSILQPVDADVVLELAHCERLRREVKYEALLLCGAHAGDIGIGVVDDDQDHAGGLFLLVGLLLDPVEFFLLFAPLSFLLDGFSRIETRYQGARPFQ